MKTASSGRTLRVGTRGSRLALVQTDWVMSELRRVRPSLSLERVVVSTRGDRDHSRPLAQMGGTGLFVKELETALLDERVDLAVHSLKDVPVEGCAGLAIAAVPVRAPCGDLFVSARFPALLSAPPDTKVGTGSARRKVQLLWAHPGLAVVGIRGNLDTRLRKVREGVVDAVVVAEAGLLRLGTDVAQGLHVEPLSDDIMLPSAGQGALALQTRDDDDWALSVAGSMNHPQSLACVQAERAFLEGVGGGCHHPVAVLGRASGPTLHLRSRVAREDNGFLVCLEGKSEPGQTPRELGLSLAEQACWWLGKDVGEEA